MTTRRSLTQFRTLAVATPPAPAPTEDDNPDIVPSSNAWSGVLGVEGEATGDGRFIQHGALRWDELPVPLRYVSSDVGAHDGAVVVGTIDAIERRPGGIIWGTGMYDDSEVAQEAKRMVHKRLSDGVSMDLDDVSFEVRLRSELVEDADSGEGVAVSLAGEADDDGRVTVAQVASDDEMMITTDGRIRAATQVAIPAFSTARLTLGAPVAALVAADSVDSMPEDDDSDGPATSDGSAEWDAAMAALAAVEQLEFLSPEYLAATDEAGDLFAAAAQALNDTDPGKALQAAEAAAKLKRFAALDWGNPEDVQTRESGPTAPVDVPPIEGGAPLRVRTPRSAMALVAGAAPIKPPKAWFDDPHLTGPTPLHVGEDGRIYGHLATWDVCHIAAPSGPGVCVVAPHSARGYQDFLLGATLTEEGTTVPTGKITMDTGHAGPKLNARNAAAHYDNTGAVVADVTAGEDMWGIWVAGALRPNVGPDKVRALRAAPLSGDWRERGGNLELVAALAVTVPGFPIPRPGGMVASGELVSLVASGMLAPEEPVNTFANAGGKLLTASDVDYLLRLANRERMTEAQSMAARVAVIKNRAKVRAFAQKRKG